MQKIKETLTTEWVSLDTFINGTVNTGEKYRIYNWGNDDAIMLETDTTPDASNTDGELIKTNESYSFTKSASSTLYMRAKNYETVLNVMEVSSSGSGNAVWGDITGTLSDQTDLADALSAKQATLVSGTNIKTINDQSLLGSGNIAISGSVPNQNTASGATTPLEFWEGTEQQWNTGGGSTTYAKWKSTGEAIVYTTSSEPDIGDTVYSEPGVVSALTITSTGAMWIRCSDNVKYEYNGSQTVSQTIGEAHPSWICNIESVGVKKGNTLIADATGEVLPTQTGNSGKYLTTNGTTASWATVSSGGLQNEATASNSISILGGDTTYEGSLIIGEHASVNGINAIAIGCEDNDYNGTHANAFGTAIGGGMTAGTGSIAIGFYKSVTGNNSIGLNADTSNNKEFVVGYDDQNGDYASYLLLNLATGKIPTARIGGATGSFTTNDGKTVTVTDGVITSIV